MTRRRQRLTETGRLVPCSFLENTVQKWYMLYDKVNDKCGNPCDEALPGDDAQ